MLREKILKRPVVSTVRIFIVLMAVHAYETLVMRLDQTAWGENFLTKVIGILLLFFLLKQLFWTWDDIGFDFDELSEGFSKGIKIAILCFTFADCFELLYLSASGKRPHFEIFTGSFSRAGEMVKAAGAGAYILCILFNIINVWMEEGMFRGLFINMMNTRMKFLSAGLISAVLFGIWHWVLPIRSFIDGELDGKKALLYAGGYFILAAMMGIKWAMMREMDGYIWQAATDHLFNNLVVTNLLHVVTDSGVDEWLIARVALGQILSFLMILILYRKKDQPVVEKPRRFRRPPLMISKEKSQQEAKNAKKANTKKRKK